MNAAKARANEINSIKTEIDRLTKHIKVLRVRKKKSEMLLAKQMRQQNITEIEGIKLKSIEPKPRTKLKPKKQRRVESIQLFRDTGVPDPEGFWNKLQSLQKYHPE